MKPIVTTAIVLARTNFQEADRIVTLLTPEGKARLVAKGVRRPKSKLAGGIELFSIGEITYLQGKGDLGTLISARLTEHYGQISSDIERTMYGYELLKRFQAITEAVSEQRYFNILKKALEGLNEMKVPLEIIDLWTTMQLLAIGGHTPNLVTDTSGQKLAAEGHYVFSFDDMAFAPFPDGEVSGPLIKLLRVGLGADSPRTVGRVSGIEPYLHEASRLTKKMGELQMGL